MLYLAGTNQDYAQALFNNFLDWLPFGSSLRHKWLAWQSQIAKTSGSQVQQTYIYNYVLSEDETKALNLILEKLELSIPLETLLAHLKEKMVRSDWDNLLVLLDFVLHHLLYAPKDVAPKITRASAFESKLNRPLNILFVTGQFPNPIHGGGGRVVDFIKIMSREHCIHLYSLFIESEDSTAYQELRPYCAGIERVDFQDFVSRPDRVMHFVADTPIDIVHYEWPRSLTNYAPGLGKHHIFTYIEAVSLRLLMDLAFEKLWSTPWVNKTIELFNTLKVEIVDTAQMGTRIVVTQKDGEFLARFNPAASFVVLNHGINFDEFYLPDKTPQENTLAFVGNYLHYPNEDAAEFFFTQIYSLVKAEIPDLKVYLVGANPTKKVSAYHNNRSIIVTGKVDDIRPYIQQAAVCIAPLITGAGIRGKVNQYAALKRVCVATSIATADLVYEDGIDIFIADDPAVFAEKTVYLLKNPEIAKKMAELAYHKALLYYDNQQLVRDLYSIYSNLEAAENNGMLKTLDLPK